VIFELGKNDFHKVLPLYLREDILFPLILAVIQRRQHGCIFVDDLIHPSSALVVTKFGFMQLIGSENFGVDILNFLKSPEPAAIPSYLLWYSPPDQIQEALDRFVPDRIRRRDRVRFIFNSKKIENLVESPTGFYVRILDEDLLSKTQRFKLDIGSRFWSSQEDFLKNGLGTCVMKDEEIVSICYAACVIDNLAEVDVVTWEEYRGMGLAIVAAQYFMSECIRRGVKPTWDCFVTNTASMKLANRLGFTPTMTYPFYSFNIPVDLAFIT
jgi:hypothetical protein